MVQMETVHFFVLEIGSAVFPGLTMLAATHRNLSGTLDLIFIIRVYSVLLGNFK